MIYPRFYSGLHMLPTDLILGRWDDPVGRERNAVVRVEAQSRGLPDHLADKTYAFGGPLPADLSDLDLWVIDDDQLWPLTDEDLDVIVRSGAGIVSSRTGSGAISALGIFLVHGQRLWLLNDSSTYDDIHVLETATRLTTLVTYGSLAKPVSLAALADLEELHVEGDLWDGLDELKKLRVFRYVAGKRRSVPNISGPIEVLDLTGVSRIDELSFLADPSRLREFIVVKAGVVDAVALRPAMALSRAHFGNSDGVINADALLSLSELRTLDFADVTSVSPTEPLRMLHVEDLAIWGNKSFNDEFVEYAREVRGWAVEPMKKRGKNVPPWKLTRLDFDLDVIDDQVMVTFSDWGLASARAETLGVNLGEEIYSHQVEELFMSLGLAHGKDPVEPDSEADRVTLWFKSMAAAKRAVGVLIRHWNDDTTALGPFTEHHHQ